jgi:hypothetical protein
MGPGGPGGDFMKSTSRRRGRQQLPRSDGQREGGSSAHVNVRAIDTFET